MWEIIVTFLLRREVVWQIKTHSPPLLGDRVELSNGTFLVTQRVWRKSNLEQKMLDVTLEEDHGEEEKGAGYTVAGAGSRGAGAPRGRARRGSAR